MPNRPRQPPDLIDPPSVEPSHSPNLRSLNRRSLLLAGGGLGLGVVSSLACESKSSAQEPSAPQGNEGSAREPSLAHSSSAKAQSIALHKTTVLDQFELGTPPWPTFDPFLFCVHHHDEYPQGNGQLGPTASLGGRRIGSDFSGKDGWSMYHGDVVPGFPRHPHRGFETVTITRRGFVDHSDSLGATARYGQGDVQWMTAGRGIVHAEMFPLLSESQPNPAELFQIWLNLPRKDKFAAPHFSMFWKPRIPTHVHADAAGRITKVDVIAGKLGSDQAPAPPPSSYASHAGSDVAIFSIRMPAGAHFVLPKTGEHSHRTLYFFSGAELRVGTERVKGGVGVRLLPSADADLIAESGPVELLLLQGKPIGEPVVQHGPFVMNERQEIVQAMQDYRKTQFGGWPWQRNDPVHSQQSGRFAVHADGRKERGV